jgi:hypothetical protein
VLPERDPPPEVAWIFGTVTCKETGHPLQGAKVFADSERDCPLEADPMEDVPDNFVERETLTDAQGGYRLEIPLGEKGFQGYALSVGAASPEDYVHYDSSGTSESSTFPPLSPGEERQHDVALKRAVGIVVTLVRADGGHSAGVCRVFFCLRNPQGEPEFGTGSEQFIDRWEMGGIDPEAVDLDQSTLRIGKEDRPLDMEIALKDYPLVAGRKTVEVRLDPGQTLKGLVLGPDGLPYGKPECRILCWPEGQDKPQEFPAACRPDPDGTFTLEYLPRTPSAFLLQAEGMPDAIQPEPVRAVAGRLAEIHLQTGGQVSGRVTDRQGKPVARALVRAWFAGEHPMNGARSLTTDAEGRYVVSGLPFKPGLIVAAYPPESLLMWRNDEEAPTTGEGDEVIPPVGWKDVPVGMISLDMVLGDGSGIQRYP